MKNFLTLELAIQFYEHIEKLKVPKHFNDQLLRAASSISLNLAEGNAKFSRKDKVRFYQISMGSLRECQTIFRLAKVENENILKLADRLGGCLYKLMKTHFEATDPETRSIL